MKRKIEGNREDRRGGRWKKRIKKMERCKRRTRKIGGNGRTRRKTCKERQKGRDGNGRQMGKSGQQNEAYDGEQTE